MKSFVAKALGIVTVLAGLAAAHPADACGTSQVGIDQDFAQPPDQVSQLFAQAERLEARARSMDTTAAQIERSAEGLTARAREIRIQASTRGELVRARLLAQADEIGAQAAVQRASAQQRRAQASQLRVTARETRQRALQLAGNPRPRPWRGATASGGDFI